MQKIYGITEPVGKYNLMTKRIKVNPGVNTLLIENIDLYGGFCYVLPVEGKGTFRIIRFIAPHFHAN